MPSVRFTFLGLPCVELPEATVPLACNRPMQLLAHLAVSGAWEGRDHIAHLFWPDRPNKIARSNLRNLLCKVQDTAPFAPIETTQHALRLKAPSDLEDFEAAMQRQEWEVAVRTGGMELMEGFESTASEPYLLWLQAEREARLGQWKKAVQALLEQTSRPLEYREALAESWALRCPFDEDAVEARVSLAYERHQTAAAARIYRAFETRLRDELGVRPSVDLEHFALRAASSPAVSEKLQISPGPADTTRSSTLQRPSMIGRRLEVLKLKSLLKEDVAQLVTVTGPGGVGKSTLLAAFHRQLSECNAVDAFLVDVSGAPTAQAALVAITSAIGVESPQGVPEEETLADALGERRWLLMIDGAEQLGLAAPLARLLERCPQTRWLVASRQRLHLDNEHLLVLDGFPLPDADETDSESLGANDGVRFLADAIDKAGQPVNMARDAAALAAIVRAVEGLPLALKLLGKLTHLFSLRQLLDSVCREPEPGTPSADSVELTELLPSLLASFQRSWMSLSPSEQSVLARLAVFPAEFDIAAGRWVAKAELPLIISLVDRSLIRATGAGRLSMHAAIRSCVQSLCPEPSATAVTDYLAYYTQRLRSLSSLARTRTTRPLEQFVDAEKIHLSRAWAVALERRDYATLLSLQESSWFLDDGTRTSRDFNARCIEAERLTRNDATVPPALRAMLLTGIAQDFFYQTRWAQAVDYARQALRQGQRARHYESTVGALVVLSWTNVYQGDNKQAEALICRLEALLASADESSGLMAMGVCACRATLALSLRKLETCLEHYGRAANFARRFENPDSELICLMGMAAAYHSFDMPDRAVQFEDQALAVGAEGKSNPALIATYLSEITQWNIDHRNIERAAAYMEQANALVRDHPQRRILRLRIHLGHAAVLTAQGSLAAARAHLCEVLDVIGSEHLPGVCSVTFVIVARWFRLAGDRQACLDALQPIFKATLRGAKYRVAMAMLRELDEKLPDLTSSENQNSDSCTAAIIAKQRMMQLIVPTQRNNGAVRSVVRDISRWDPSIHAERRLPAEPPKPRAATS